MSWCLVSCLSCLLSFTSLFMFKSRSGGFLLVLHSSSQASLSFVSSKNSCGLLSPTGCPRTRSLLRCYIFTEPNLTSENVLELEHNGQWKYHQWELVYFYWFVCFFMIENWKSYGLSVFQTVKLTIQKKWHVNHRDSSAIEGTTVPQGKGNRGEDSSLRKSEKLWTMFLGFTTAA